MREEASEPQLIRAFIGIPLGKILVKKIECLQDELKTASAHVRWVAPENIHLTLVFLGNISQSIVPAISDALEQLVDNKTPFSLVAKGLGFFGSQRMPRVIWLGITGDLNPVITLQKDLVSLLRRIGLKYDNERFKPHLTLGRIRSHRNVKNLIALLQSNKNTEYGAIVVKQILLIQSRLTRDGPVYTTLHEANFRASNGTD